jgi:hypothetical protein
LLVLGALIDLLKAFRAEFTDEGWDQLMLVTGHVKSACGSWVHPDEPLSWAYCDDPEWPESWYAKDGTWPYGYVPRTAAWAVVYDQWKADLEERRRQEWLG